MHVFTAYGDADKENMSLNIRSSYIRMAETRAIVRCLRFATNIAETSIEEIHEVKEEWKFFLIHNLRKFKREFLI